MGYRLLEGSSITRLRGSPNRWEASTNRLIQMVAIEEGNRPSGRAGILGRTNNHITGKIGILKRNEGQLAL